MTATLVTQPALLKVLCQTPGIHIQRVNKLLVTRSREPNRKASADTQIQRAMKTETRGQGDKEGDFAFPVLVTGLTLLGGRKIPEADFSSFYYFLPT